AARSTRSSPSPAPTARRRQPSTPSNSATLPRSRSQQSSRSSDSALPSSLCDAVNNPFPVFQSGFSGVRLSALCKQVTCHLSLVTAFRFAPAASQEIISFRFPPSASASSLVTCHRSLPYFSLPFALVNEGTD